MAVIFAHDLNSIIVRRHILVLYLSIVKLNYTQFTQLERLLVPDQATNTVEM